MTDSSLDSSLDPQEQTAETREQKLRGPILARAPMMGGTQRGKVKLTFADGTHAIFKPASGEGCAVRSKKDP